MSDFEEFDRLCDEWEAAHPGEAVPHGELFADWLAGETGTAIIGGPVGEPPTVVAVPAEAGEPQYRMSEPPAPAEDGGR